MAEQSKSNGAAAWPPEHHDGAAIDLRDIVTKYQLSTEALQASNDQLQLAHALLRSTSDELAASRESLRSVNQELTLVNQELKDKIAELKRNNLELNDLMGATAFATMFLDRQLCILRFTRPAEALFDLTAADVGLPLVTLQHDLVYPGLPDDAALVLKNLLPIEREVPASDGRHFLGRIFPYRTSNHQIIGVVLTFVDVSDRQRAQMAADHSAERNSLALERRVRERTAELDEANASLRLASEMRHQAEQIRRDLRQRLVNAQEEERRRLSRELHDEVGQQTTALMLSLTALDHEILPPEAAAKLRDVREAAALIGTEVHRLATQLRPAAVDALGLSQALRTDLERLGQRSGIAVDFFLAGIDEPRLPGEIEVTVYRIVQEATSNVLRHAAARNVSVSIVRREDQLVAIVADDGRGFDPDAPPTSKGGRIGLTGMKERVAIFDGELTIESGPGGTMVRVKLPIPAG